MHPRDLQRCLPFPSVQQTLTQKLGVSRRPSVWSGSLARRPTPRWRHPRDARRLLEISWFRHISRILSASAAAKGSFIDARGSVRRSPGGATDLRQVSRYSANRTGSNRSASYRTLTSVVCQTDHSELPDVIHGSSWQQPGGRRL